LQKNLTSVYRGVNRYLIEGMAFMGNGEPMIITEQNGAEEQAERFRNYINTPVLTRIETNFGSFKTYDVEPVAIPDMLAERPIIIFGKYKDKPEGRITLSGKTGRKTYKQSFDLSDIQPNTAYSALRYLWARERIKYLDYMISGSYSYDDSPKNDEVVKKITELGLKYNLMTNYTSFIAVDEQIVMKDGKLVTVQQSIPIPEGVSDYAVGYERNVSLSAFISADISEPFVVAEEKSLIFSHVEVMPIFPGGDAAMLKFITDNIVYPPEMVQQGVTGRVILRFVVTEDGSITDIEILKGVNPLLNAEAIRVVKLMPKWLPGRQNGNPARVYYTLPIWFKLQQNQ
jgi:Ca-activated chloride channel family protein